MSAWRRERPDSFRKALQAAKELLSANQLLVARGLVDTEAEQLVIAALRSVGEPTISRSDMFLRIADRFPDLAGDKLLSLAGARAEGKPLQHLTGYQVFLDHEYEVGPDVLVPRPETEFLVVTALEELARRFGKPELGLEVGLGSGAISVEMLSGVPALAMVASELTDAAVARARSNARRILGEGYEQRLEIVRPTAPLDVLTPFTRALKGRRAQFLISNPPYLIATDPIDSEVIDFEPHSALFAPEKDALHFYREIAVTAGHHLAPGGCVFLELAPERAEAIRDLFAQRGWESKISRDLTDRDRVLVASLAGTR